MVIGHGAAAVCERQRLPAEEADAAGEPGRRGPETARPRLGRGDDAVGNPHRAQISQFELFELKFLNSSFSSSSSY